MELIPLLLPPTRGQSTCYVLFERSDAGTLRWSDKQVSLTY